ncbi:tetraacyldisaccharide 4'-kinase [Bdellovibrio reynosensis]|uniref:Tetraacyldisaccharide 4'-kinase n=1 Tax=Bdellovibrio reynosensis TaxID=2835041 RepID=A0ABY4CCG0_9BACT|nr:tetraacyldisaccharide 4'-kinase [Bdellovibrio reynosensis]UOF02409.1 tetraacyldisaccharide 4'-kinase [Bdellovibrio reynosensis]
MKFYLKPLSFLYDRLVETKNHLYDRGIIKSYQAPVPVVSIGNLTVGGTGKTPITDLCLKHLSSNGKKVAVISRSYRADAESACQVDVSHPFAARYFGDEPVLLAQANPAVSVFVGPKKWATAQYAVAKDEFDLLIVDDGFQHRKLHRDLNIVILDATENIENYHVLPEGRARESWDRLDRSDLIIVSKANLASQADLKNLEARLPKNKEVLYCGYGIHKIHNLQTAEVKETASLAGKKLFLVSAIARPDVFEKMMGEMGEVSEDSLHYRDHHQYTESDIKNILTQFKKSQADFLITTEKDAVKLRPLFEDASLLWSAPLEVSELGKKGRLHEIINQVLR